MISVKKNKGFTLVELMVTLGIVGVLMSFAIPGYKDYVDKAKISEAISLMLKTSDEASNCLIDVNTWMNLGDCLNQDWNSKSATSGWGGTYSYSYFENSSNKNFTIRILPWMMQGTPKGFRIDVISKDENIYYSYIPFDNANERYVTYYIPWSADPVSNYDCWVINKKGDCYEF